MHVSEDVGDVTAVSSSSSEQDVRKPQLGTPFTPRAVRVLPVSQLAPSPTHGQASSPAPLPPLKQSARAKQLEEELGHQRPWLEILLPSLQWMKAYKWRDSLKTDAVAGITVGTMLIPQVANFLKMSYYSMPTLAISWLH